MLSSHRPGTLSGLHRGRCTRWQLGEREPCTEKWMRGFSSSRNDDECARREPSLLFCCTDGMHFILLVFGPFGYHEAINLAGC